MTDDERFCASLQAATANFVIPNARRIAGQRYKKAANWVLAMQVYGLGSTFAWRLCLENGLDPNATH